MFATKPIEALEPDSPHNSMKRVLGPADLTLLGIGAIIGTGIFVLTGRRSSTTEEFAMRKIVLTFGLIAGAVMSALMVIAMVFQDAIGFDRRAFKVGRSAAPQANREQRIDRKSVV